MNRKHRARLSLTTMVLTAIFFLAVSPLNACIVRNMTYEQAFAETDSTVIAEIVEILPSREGQLSRSFNYKVRVMQSERGAMKVGALINVELLLDLARNIHGSIMCPLQRGSGAEDELEVGKRYRMLIKKDADRFELYWGEDPQASHTETDAT
jgi:hypothetical protein